LAYTIGQARKDKFNEKHISVNEYGYEAVAELTMANGDTMLIACTLTVVKIPIDNS
jgi:hypothetical protein